MLVSPTRALEQDDKDDPGKPDSACQLVFGLLFGFVFGFLLQKGGVAKYEVLMGQFFLTDFTVIMVMLTAIIVGMLGILSLRALGQGDYDAIAGILGLMAGSYFYAETSGYVGSTIQKIGNRGGIMLPDLLGMRLAVFLAVFEPGNRSLCTCQTSEVSRVRQSATACNPNRICRAHAQYPA